MEIRIEPSLSRDLIYQSHKWGKHPSQRGSQYLANSNPRKVRSLSPSATLYPSLLTKKKIFVAITLFTCLIIHYTMNFQEKSQKFNSNQANRPQRNHFRENLKIPVKQRSLHCTSVPPIDWDGPQTIDLEMLFGCPRPPFFDDPDHPTRSKSQYERLINRRVIKKTAPYPF